MCRINRNENLWCIHIFLGLSAKIFFSVYLYLGISYDLNNNWMQNSYGCIVATKVANLLWNQLFSPDFGANWGTRSFGTIFISMFRNLLQICLNLSESKFWKNKIIRKVCLTIFGTIATMRAQHHPCYLQMEQRKIKRIAKMWCLLLFILFQVETKYIYSTNLRNFLIRTTKMYSSTKLKVPLTQNP